MPYSVFLDKRALQDIQDAINYYDSIQIGMGKKFEKSLHQHILILQKNPMFRVRYGKVRCLMLVQFPYMLHFTVKQKSKEVIIWALLHTAQDPEKWPNK